MATEWKVGDRLENRWEIHRIMRGGMSSVYVVSDHESEFKTAYAAKTYQDEVFAANPGSADRFTQQALAWVKLDAHENVARAHFVVNIAGKPFLFQEYVSGGDLSRWIGTPRLTEDPRQVLRFAIQFCDGMAHALSKGIVAHRDIKPQNCLVTEGGTLKVTDFDLAKAFSEARAEPMESWTELPAAPDPGMGLTRTGAGAGTPTHMAPEQFEDFKHVTVRADIYSFGVMLFQMFSGSLPFVGRSWEEFQDLHANQPPPVLTGQPSPINDIIQKSMAKDAAHRFGDFAVLREQLAEVYQVLTGEIAPRPAVGVDLDASDWNDKGTSLANLGRPDEALACYDRSLELNPRDVMCWNNKGITLEELGRPEEALACYDRALELNPGFAETWYIKGTVLGTLGQLEEAFTCYDRALELNPRHARAWNNKGNMLDDLGRPQEAVPCYDRALELDPRFELAWYNKGNAQSKLGRPQEAVPCYCRALELNPRYTDAWFNMGMTFLNAFKRHREALEYFEKAQELGDPSAAQLIAHCRRQLGE